MKLARTSLLTLIALLVCAAPAAAESKTYTFRTGPITVGPYQVKQGLALAPKPPGDGYVTAMDVDVVDPDGSRVPIDRLMLHHIVFANVSRRDGTCDAFTGLDSVSKFRPAPERFYGAGEERMRLLLPDGHGYPTAGSDTWGLNYMFMNHRGRTDRAYIEYHVTWETEPLTPVKPYWLDVRNCESDPVYDVPGGGRRGSTHSRTFDWTAPQSGRIVAGGGHVHGGARGLTLQRRDCGPGGDLYRSRPTWGGPRHPFYRVRPILHEPGPISMSGFRSRQGFPVARGERLRLRSDYDGELPHTRVMGIMVVYMAPDPAPREPCGIRPSDVEEVRSSEPGRTVPPRFRVPIVGRDRRGRVRSIARPPGRRKAVRSGTTIGVGDLFFSRPNVAVRQGALLRWRFSGDTIHNVTVADGPRGFSSANLNAGRRYRKRLNVPGEYKLFCALHPVEMTSTVKVLRRKRGRR